MKCRLVQQPERQQTNLNSFLESVDGYNTKDRSKDFGFICLHVSVHVGDDGRAHEVAVGVFVHLDVTSVKLEVKN